MVSVQPVFSSRSREARPIWIEPLPVPIEAAQLHRDPLIAELLFRRNITDAISANEFLHDRPRPAPNPWLLPNMEPAVARIVRAIDTGETVAIFGDYDVDGITATALLTRALRLAIGDRGRIIPRLPIRSEGYGLNKTAIDEFVAAKATLLIAVDCASSDNVSVTYARGCGLDVVVVDHHHMQGPAPAGAIVVSPQLIPNGPYREMAAVGLVYLLVVALAQHGCPIGGVDGEPETELLDFVALGTIGDVSPLIGVNRALVRDGLRQIRKRPRPGLVALMRKAGLDPASVTSDRVAYKLAPRINAAGRIGDPHVALDLMLCDDQMQAAMLAEEIEVLNSERRLVSSYVIDEAESFIFSLANWDAQGVLIAIGKDWPQGVLGIAANQLVERFGRPAFVLVDDGVSCKGSARSVPGFDITAALNGCQELLTAWGGHNQAAGLTIQSGNLEKLAESLNRCMEASGLEVPVPPSINLDAELPVSRLTLDTARSIDALQPFGAANEQPVFLIKQIEVRQYDVVGQDASHLKLVFNSPRGAVKGIAFGAAARSKELVANRFIDLAACLNIDNWNGQTRLDLEIKDFRPAH